MCGTNIYGKDKCFLPLVHRVARIQGHNSMRDGKVEVSAYNIIGIGLAVLVTVAC